jgi:hypothetical protein
MKGRKTVRSKRSNQSGRSSSVRGFEFRGVQSNRRTGRRSRKLRLRSTSFKALLNHNDKGVTGIYARWHMFEEKREVVLAIEAAVFAEATVAVISSSVGQTISVMSGRVRHIGSACRESTKTLPCLRAAHAARTLH